MKFATLLTPSSVYMSRTPFSNIPRCATSIYPNIIQWAQWSQRKRNIICINPASKKYRTHIGPKWVFIWVLHGQPIRDSWGICNRVPCWTHMGKAMWELYGSSMGKINPHLSSRKTIFTQMIISLQSQTIWWTGKVPTDRDLCTCACYCLKDIGIFFNS